MPNLTMRAANCSSQTAQWLTNLLNQKPGISTKYKENGDAIVCYGWGTDEANIPVLNANAGKLDNLGQLRLLKNEGNVRIPNLVIDLKRADFATLKFPMLARSKRHDGGGHDIMPVMQEEELNWRKEAGADFFVEYIPRQAEYRVWVYRRQILAVYSKEMTNPEKYTGIGCNEKDGFKHIFKQNYINIPGMDNILQYSARAVYDLGLDFGGVDVIYSKSNRAYILEVNTAPGANGPNAVGLVKLSNRIAKWANNGYPKQRKQFIYNGVVDADED